MSCYFDEIKSKNPQGTILLFAGGPGLSANSLKDLRSLNEKFDLVLVDLPDCGKAKNSKILDYDSTISEISEFVETKKSVHLLGHSFGGYIATEVALKIPHKIESVICIGVPFSNKSLEKAGENYERYKTPELVKATEQWSAQNDDQSFSQWLSAYEVLYFCKESAKGKKLLQDDVSSAKLFTKWRSSALDKEGLLTKMKAQSFRKLFIAGREDKMLDYEILKSDAVRGGFDFSGIEDASHFSFVDQPQRVSEEITKFITSKGGSK